MVSPLRLWKAHWYPWQQPANEHILRAHWVMMPKDVGPDEKGAGGVMECPPEATEEERTAKKMLGYRTLIRYMVDKFPN